MLLFFGQWSTTVWNGPYPVFCLTSNSYLLNPTRTYHICCTIFSLFLSSSTPLLSSGWLACFSQISLFPLANVSNLAGHTDCSHIYCSIYFRYKLDVIVVVWVAKTIATNKKLAGKKAKGARKEKGEYDKSVEGEKRGNICQKIYQLPLIALTTAKRIANKHA